MRRGVIPIHGKRRDSLLAIFLSAPLGFLSLSQATQAFVRVGSLARWQALPVPYRINETGLPSLSNGSEFTAIHSAFKTWQDVPTSAVAFVHEGTTEIQNGGNDGTNVISFQDTDFAFGSGTIAVTLSTSTAGRFLDADILFNPNLAFSTSGEGHGFDVQAITTHEIGHFLGLDHTAIVSATMNPTGAPGSVFPRVLKSDDTIGASIIYPESNFNSTTGAIQGRITGSGGNVFGAHVVVLDTQGRTVVSALSNLDGTYQISGLPPGTYSLYAEPLDGPVTEANIGGQFDSTVNTNFTTTFLGNTVDKASRQTITVGTGNMLSNLNIAVLVSPATPFNLTSPGVGLLAEQGTSGSLAARGTGLSKAEGFFILGDGITLSVPTFSSTDNARLPVVINPAAPTGPRTLFAEKTDGLVALSGGFVVTGPVPRISSISPNSGSNEGGTIVTITGSNFAAGTRVFLAGAALAHPVILSPTTIQGTTPPNKTGILDILALNPDGASSLLSGAFTSVALAPAVTSITPLSGPPTTVVTITGSHFDTSVLSNQVFFSNVQAEIASASITQILAIVPFGTSTGRVRVVTFGQEALGPVFTVTAPIASNNRAEAQFQYIDASDSAGGARLDFGINNDDAALQTALPFNFSLFTSTFLSGSKLWVATNGWLSLNKSVTNPAEWQNGLLPGTTLPREGLSSGQLGSLPSNLIAPFFDDLILQRSDSAVFARVVGATPNRRLVIEWRNLNIIDQDGEVLDSRITFQAILYEGSNDIAFQYQAMEGLRSSGGSATVGIQNASRNAAVQYGFNQSRLAPGKSVALRFNPTNGSYALTGNEPRLFIPFAIDNPRFRTNLGLTNISDSEAAATLTLLGKDGNVLGSRTASVPAHGLAQLNNVIRYIRASGPNAVTNLSGSIVISSDQALIAFATQIDNTSNDPSFQIGRHSGMLEILIPSTTSVSPFRSSLIIQNAGESAALVRLRQRDHRGSIRQEIDVTIPENGSFQTDDLHAALGLSGIFGPLEIASSNFVPVVAASRVFATNSGTSGFFEGVDTELAAPVAIIPMSQDTNAIRTNLGINNLGEAEANVEINFFNPSGTLLGSKSVAVPAKGLTQLNHVNRLITGATGVSNTTGYIRMRSDQPIAGFASLISNAGNDPSLAQNSIVGANRIFMPSSTNVNQFRSNLTLVNLGTNVPAPIQLTARDSSGRIIAQSSNLIVPPEGILNIDDVLSWLGVQQKFGPIEILSTNNVPLVAVSRVYSASDNTSGFFPGQPF